MINVFKYAIFLPVIVLLCTNCASESARTAHRIAINENLSYKGKHITEWAHKLSMPLLLMWSEPGSEISWGLSHFFRVPGAEMHLLPWSGHHLFADQRDRWIQVVTDWLSQEPPAPPSP